MTRNEVKGIVLGIFNKETLGDLVVKDMRILLGTLLEEFPDFTEDICLKCFAFLNANSVPSYFDAILIRAIEYLITQRKFEIIKALINEYPHERKLVIDVICGQPDESQKAAALKELAKQDLLSVPEIIQRHPELTLEIIEANPAAISLVEAVHIISEHSSCSFEDRLEVIVSLARRYPQQTPKLMKGAGKDFYSAIVKVLAESVTGEE